MNIPVINERVRPFKVLKNQHSDFRAKLKSQLAKDTISFGNKAEKAPKKSMGMRDIAILLSLMASSVLGYETYSTRQDLNTLKLDLAKAQGVIETLQNQNVTLNTKLDEQGALIAELKYKDLTIEIDILKNKKMIEHLSSFSLERVQQVLDNVAPSTVKIETPNGSTGSGFIIKDKDGHSYILTNAHVTDFAIDSTDDMDDHQKYNIEVYTGNDYASPYAFEAQIYEYEPGVFAETLMEKDMAVLKVPDEIVLPDSTTGLKLRNQLLNPVKAGEMLIAIGNPQGLKDSVSVGFVSNANRVVSSAPDNNYIQIDGSINPGNSGGAIIDLDGNVIAINQMMSRGSVDIIADVPLEEDVVMLGDGNGIGYAIRSDTILNYLNEIGIELKK